MSVIVIYSSNKIGRNEYEHIRSKAGWESNPPEGIVSHACAFDSNGNLLIFDVWETEAQMEKFMSGRIGPVVSQMGLPPPGIKVLPAHNVNVFAPANEFAVAG